MGNRRLSRKRLYQVEKLGQAVDIEAAEGIKNAISSATQHRNGQEIITEIAVDLGSSKGTIIGASNGDGYAVGEASKVAYVTQLTKAKYGLITEIRAVLLEAPTTGGTNIELEHVANASKQTNQQVSGTKIAQNLATVGQDESTAYDTHVTLGQNGTAHYLYIVLGAGGAASQFDTGKLLIYIHGFATPDDL